MLIRPPEYVAIRKPRRTSTSTGPRSGNSPERVASARTASTKSWMAARLPKWTSSGSVTTEGPTRTARCGRRMIEATESSAW